MAKKKAGDGAKPEVRWALVILCDGKPWINPFHISYGRADCKRNVIEADVRGFTAKDYGKMWTVRKVTITPT